MHKTLLSVFLSSSLVLTGCGGGSSGLSGDSSDLSGSSTTAKTGQFIDAAVVNINYKTETLSGVTDEEGKYQYEEGETVTFSIGSVTFTPVLASGIVTPLDIANSHDTEDDEVVNIIRFLQTLDTDGNPNNGITISDDVKTAALKDIDFDVTKADFESDNEVLVVITQGGQESTISTLIDESDALSHFERSLDSFDITFGKFVGTWIISSDDENELLLFTFFEDGTYIHAEIDTDPQNAENPDEINGMEWGEYEVNDLEEFFSKTTYFDENGDTGLTDIITSDLTDSQDGATVVFSFIDNSLTLKFNITEYENNVKLGTETKTFSKLTNNGIVGTWLIAGENENELLMLTFLDDGTYVHAEVDRDSSTAENPSEDNGLEWGNYELNSQTNEMTISFDSLETDLNGDTGLSNFADSSDNQLFVTVSGDVMKVRVVEGSDEETLTFYRH